MANSERTQNYINNFRRRLTPFLRPGLGLVCTVYPVSKGGAILEFTIGQGSENDDKFLESNPTFGTALGGIKQHAFGGNLDGFDFKGTNTIVDGNRIIFIKDEPREEWNDTAAEKDVNNIISSARKASGQ